MKRHGIAVLREALGAGEYGGWRRDPETWRTQVKAWVHSSDTEKVSIEPGEPGGYSRLRILLRDDPAEPWTVHCDCLVRSPLSLILVLVAFRIVGRRHSIDWQIGRSSGIADVRKAMDRVW